MKYILIASLVVISFACKTSSKITKKDVSVEQIKKVQLSDTEKRKFDYFFYEASREKMKGNIEKTVMYLSECLKIDPTSSASMYELANILVNGNEVVKAQGLLERAILIEPNNIWYKLLLAQLYQQNQLGVKAIQLYEDIVETNPNNEEYLYGLAQIYAQNGKFDNAIDAYEKLEKLVGLNEVIIVEKEKIYLELGKNKDALNELERLTKKYPEEARYYGYIADYYLYLKDYQSANSFYYKVLDKDPNNGMVYFSLGNLALTQKDTTSFIDHYTKGLYNKSTPFEVKFQRIIPLLVDGNEFNESNAFIEDFLLILTEVHPFEANSFIYLGNYYKATNKKKKAISAFKDALSIEESNELIWQEYCLLLIDDSQFEELYSTTTNLIVKFDTNAFFYLIGGSAAMQIDKDEEALAMLMEGIQFSESNPPLKSQFFAIIGDVNFELGNSKEAFESYDNSLKLDEFNIVVLNNYSYYLTLENRDLDKAERMSSKCIEMEPGNSTYLDTYAWVLFKRERYFEAKYIIERAIDNGGSDSDVIVEHYGDILFKNGDIDGALVQWIKSLEMGNESKTLPEKIKSKNYIEE
ncbi:tetratricopeptide repeat protein [Carboxylicivirga sp. N1Y90]|uniref:tetratricopeptide repeat protein n=1 Tax=Carboxylicivirga fragile TaxID=3417571 RepID=UPI003D33E778|nr:tetratricopeptide repeat protein [Marinilabiliaceae bacterium N1Y90]